MNLASKVSKIVDRVIDFLAYLACGLLVLALIIVVLEVIMRYFFNRPQIWVLETTEYILLLTTFMGAPWLLKREGHVNVDIAVRYLRPRARALLNTILCIIGALMCLVLAWYSGTTVWDEYQMGFKIPKVLELPRAPLLAIIPLGSFLLFVQFLGNAYRYLTIWRHFEDKGQELTSSNMEGPMNSNSTGGESPWKSG
jgi:TRAP-type C4-dicarboxylate transport system permease small subunit